MITVFSSLDLSSQNYRLWQAAEDYCWVGQKRYHVLSLENGKIHLEERPPFSHRCKTVLKVASYAFVIPVLMALIVCAYYRSFHLQPIWKEPSVEETIARLRAAQEKSLRLALFIGREAEQSIPQEEGWV